MKRKIIITQDGSTTIQIPEWQEQYHSTHGAIQEAKHVFIKNGLHYFIAENDAKNISVLEIGFGTGLNAFITLLEAEKLNLQIIYHGVEAYPVAADEWMKLNFVEQLNASEKDSVFKKLHTVSWEKPHTIKDGFLLKKEKKFFSEITVKDSFDIIYFDAFGARVQPELWTEAIFKIMYNALKTNGVLVTYSAKGSVKRALKSVGFNIERLVGPPGKRHMLRAIKTN